MFSLNDPDAAEKAARIYYEAVQAAGDPYGSFLPSHLGLRAVLDAIERPRLPTRSEVGVLCRSCGYVGRPDDCGCGGDMRHVPVYAEDPELEVDERQVDVITLAEILATAAGGNWPPTFRPDANVYIHQARNLLASGRVSVKVDECAPTPGEERP